MHYALRTYGFIPQASLQFAAVLLRPSPRLAFIISGFLFVILLALKGLNVYDAHFSGPPLVYTPYQILRVLCIPLYFFVIGGAGRLCLRWFKLETLNWLDFLLLEFITGIFAINVFTAVLVRSHLLYEPLLIAIAVVVSASYFLFPPNNAQTPPAPAAPAPASDLVKQASQITTLLIGLATLGVMALIILYSLAPDWRDNDTIGTYLPNTQQVLANHGYWPPQWFIHYFSAQGRGLQFFFAGLLDPPSIQLGYAVILFISGSIVARLFWRLTHHAGIATAGALIFMFGRLLGTSMIKSHLVFGCLLVALFYVATLVSRGKNSFYPPAAFVFILGTVSITLYLPPSLSIAGFVLFALTCVSLAQRNVQVFTTVIAAGLAGALGVLCIYLINYQETGMYDFLVRYLDRFADPQAVDHWHSWAAVQHQRFFNEQEGGLDVLSLFDMDAWKRVLKVPRHKSITPTVFYIVGGAILISATMLFTRPRQQQDNHDERHADIWMAAIFSILLLLITATSDHVAIFRLTEFRLTFPALVFVGISVIAIERIQRIQTIRELVLSLAALLIAWNLSGHDAVAQVYHWLKHDRSMLSFDAGQNDYLHYLEHRWHGALPAYNAVKDLKPGETVVNLNFNPALWMLPGFPYLRPLKSPLGADLEIVYFDTPEKAIAALNKHNAGNCYVTFDRWLLMYPALAPLFSPDTMPKYWRLLWHDPISQSYLLTLDKNRGTPIPEAFVKQYRNYFVDNVFPRHGELYEFGKKLYMQRQESGNDAR